LYHNTRLTAIGLMSKDLGHDPAFDRGAQERSGLCNGILIRDLQLGLKVELPPADNVKRRTLLDG
jgi:hypothetical protein